MKIKITTENAAKINEALDAVNGKATAFTIHFYDDVMKYAEQIEKMLEKSHLPKAERGGVIAVIRPAGPSANAYKYAAKSTAITIERGSKDWFLTKVSEASVFPKQNESATVKITPAQRDTITKKAVEAYTIAVPIAALSDA